MLWEESRIQIGGGTVTGREGDIVRLSLSPVSGREYSDAQIDDTAGRPRRRYRWRPPVRLALRACFSHPAEELVGTAGFGFWNAPFGPGLGGLPVLPRAIWFFFGSFPHNVPLAAGVPGNGWKAACLDASRPRALAWAPFTPVALLAMQSQRIHRWLWPHIQRGLSVSEAVVPVPMSGWHHYILEWGLNGAEFWVDGQRILHAPVAPRGPLGFVAWMDNQYAVATPRGRFGWGVLTVEKAQWLELGNLEID